MIKRERRLWYALIALLLAGSLLSFGVTTHAERGSAPGLPVSQEIVLPLPETSALEILAETEGDLPVLAGYGHSILPAHPKLPVRILHVLLPPDAEGVSVEIVEPQWVEIPGHYNVPPAPPLAPSDLEGALDWGGLLPENIQEGRLITIYGQDAYWPPTPISLLSVGSQRVWRIARLAYWPVAYNPVQGSLRQLQGGRIVVRFLSSGRAPLADPLSERAWQTLFHNLENPSDRVAFYETLGTQETAPQAETAPSTTNDYVIITTSAIVANSTQLAAFIQAKEQAGYSVKVVTEGPTATDTTYPSDSSAAERANNIRNWLASRYISEGIRYVLLIGNPHPTTFNAATSVPMKLTYPYSEVPTDMFYSDLSGNWDLNGNGRYGEVSDIGSGGIDRLPEVYVGRIPFYGSYTDLDSILQKTAAYQSTLDDISWRRSALIAAAISNHGPQDNNNDGIVDYDAYLRTFGDDWGEALRTLAASNGFTTYTLYEKEGVYSDGSAYPLTTANAALNTANIVSAWQSGFGIVAWWGHGSTTGAYRRVWANDNTRADRITQYPQETSSPSFFTTSQVSQLDNSRPSFVLQVSCTNGYPESADNLGYRLLVHGAVGTVSSSRLSYYILGPWSDAGDPGWGDNASLAFRVLQRMASLDEAIGEALAYYRGYAEWFGSSPLWQNMLVSNLYGDPSLSLDSHGTLSAPQPPSNPQPPDRATGVATNITLRWTSGPGFVGDTVTYDVYLSKGSSPTSIVCNGVSATSCTPGTLVAGTTYSWRVVARGIGGISEGPVWTFTTEEIPCVAPPTIPYDPLPSDGATNVPLDVDLVWCGGHTCEGEPVTYDVYLEPNTDVPSVAVCTGLSEPQCDPGPLQAGTRYVWQVVAHGLNGPVVGPVWSFETVACPLLEAPEIVAPQAGSRFPTGQAVHFQWMPTPLATNYHIQIAQDADFRHILLDEQVDGETFTPSEPLAPGIYCWRVRARYAEQGCETIGTWSETSRFAIGRMLFVPVAKK